MNKEKEKYISPDVSVFTVQTEGVICGSEFGSPGAPGSSPIFNDFGDF